ncbi:MAG: peptidylprolyl isomerase [Actinobacteria bacterium]|nr:peptidylprolyl isomerase [Actinomycetota bacterium]
MKRRRLVNLIGAAALLIIIIVVVAITTSGDDETATATSTTEAASAATSDSTDSTPATTEAPKVEIGTTPCPEVDGSSERMTEFDGAPQMCIDPAKTYTADVETTMGDFTITFDAQKAPNTVNNFVFLARYHYFDGIIFHRIIDGFVIQGGDPQGTGMGGPGYEFNDELPEAGEYEKYSLAMANSGPNTNGSQFFVITGDQGVALPPNYSLFGKVTDGTDVVDAIGTVETGTGDKPVEEVKMTKVTITES